MRLQSPLLGIALLSMTLAAAGCASTKHTPPTLAALNCAKLIPDSHRHPVTGAPLPPATAGKPELWVGLDGQTSRLDLANSHTSDVVAIADSCQAEQDKLFQSLQVKKHWYQF